MKNKGLLFSILVMLLWGLLFPMVKLSYKLFGVVSIGDILFFAGLRFVICGILILLYSLIRNPKAFRPAKANLFPILLSGVFAIILHYAFTYVGLSLTNGSKTAIIKQLGAVFYIWFAGFFFADDKINAQKVKALILALAGILVINLDSTGIHFYVGDLLIILASFCTVFSNVISKRVFQKVEPIVSTGISQFFGGLVLLVVGSLCGGQIGTFIPTNKQQILVFGGILLASTVSYCSWFLVVQKENLSKLFIVKFSEPLFAALFGALLLGEQVFDWRYLLAFLLISGSIVIANMRRGEKK